MAIMSNVDISSQITSELSRCDINSEKSSKNKSIEGKWGLPLSEVYKLALNFYKEKEGKAVQLSYEDKLQLVAFAQQVSHGPLATSKVPPVGALDVVGRDRRLAWQRLSDLSPDQSRIGFVSLLSRRCPHFEAYIEAHRRENEEKQRKAQEQALRDLERRKQREEEEKIEREIRAKQEMEEVARRKVQQALNEQTYDQFRTYAEQQYPGDPERQGDLIKQLQDQHYLQYMQQLHATALSNNIIQQSTDTTGDEELPSEEQNTEDNYFEGIAQASMWTRDDIQLFKEIVSKSEGDGVVRVGHGEIVTVRVPTTVVGTQLFWEFATDHYDIGFGVYFEWGTPTTDQVLVHVSESEEDDEDDDDYGDGEYLDTLQHTDLETGAQVLRRVNNTPMLSEIVPIYRRDSHLEVYVGSHTYPGEGCYLLKFDNSYSLWRSKTLYYRICYSN
ncbi:Golgi resident protein GCP60 [Chrysoperla carnea]|uniref:Golgi resident protein GCP60 n=1 Tax=Chrysoperla carnea TaxID=189513 RepID=UPI001D06761E|nr:Golgi resident protein GCP60 [Chrysoperla carnea]